jgi:hypothetical protein
MATVTQCFNVAAAHFFEYNHSFRSVLSWEDKRLLHEVEGAINQNFRTVALMGIRALFDSYFTRKNGKELNFTKSVEELIKNGTITLAQSKVIKKVIEAGHAAAHRNFEPDPNLLTHAMETYLTILKLECLQIQSPDITKGIPNRKK